MPNDKWGNIFLYPSKKGGFFWQQNDGDPSDDSHVEGADGLKETSTGIWEFTQPDKARMAIKKDPSFEDAIDGCDMDFSETENRGYAYKEDDMRDVEFKGKFKVNSYGDSSGGIGMGGPTGDHTDNKCCQGATYYTKIWWATNPIQIQFTKEMWHVDYHHTEPFTNTNVTNIKLQGSGWVGLGYVRYNKTNGDGKTSVILEFWISPDGSTNGWKLFATYEDKGGWGDSGDECNGDKDQILTWGSGKMRIKFSDEDADIEVKELSVREIDPFGSFEEEEPPKNNPSFGFANLPCRRNINFERYTLCSVAGNRVIYDQPSQDGVTILNGADSRTGEQVMNINSRLYGKAPKSGKVYLSKNGSPVNDVYVRIRKSIDNYQSFITIGTITASSINSTETEITFSSSNTYKLAIGDQISIEHTGNTTDYVRVYRYANSNYDGENSKRFWKRAGGDIEIHNGDLKAYLEE